MGNYVRRRLLQMIPLLFGISILVFLIIQAAPGGPETVYLSSGVLVDPEVIAAYKAKLGLDQPIYVQYVRGLVAAVRRALPKGAPADSSRVIASQLVGALQLAAAIALVAGLEQPWLGRTAAGGLALMMLVAVGVRFKIKDTLAETTPALLYLALNTYLGLVAF